MCVWSVVPLPLLELLETQQFVQEDWVQLNAIISLFVGIAKARLLNQLLSSPLQNQER